MRCAKATAGQPLCSFDSGAGWQIVTEVPSKTRVASAVVVPHRLRTAAPQSEPASTSSPFDGDLLRDDPLAEHEVAGTVDAVGGNELAARR